MIEIVAAIGHVDAAIAHVDAAMRSIDGVRWSMLRTGAAAWRAEQVARAATDGINYTLAERAAAFGLVPTYGRDAHAAWDLRTYRVLLDNQQDVYARRLVRPIRVD